MRCLTPAIVFWIFKSLERQQFPFSGMWVANSHFLQSGVATWCSNITKTFHTRLHLCKCRLFPNLCAIPLCEQHPFNVPQNSVQLFLHLISEVSQPHFWKSVRMKLTLSKWGLGSPPGLPKLQSSIAGVKTPCIVMFFISLENYWNVDVENGLAWAIWIFATQVMAKRKAGSQIGTLTPDH
jgi:hypothetical protein